MLLIANKKKPSLGIGLYSIPDVAQILHLDPAFVRRWLKEYWGNKFKSVKKTMHHGDKEGIKLFISIH